jgi:hypothetical protein
MSTREQVASGILVYTCNCGWFDTGHADSRSRRPNVGAESLWAQITGGSGQSSQKSGESGFKVTYTQDMRKWGVTAAETRRYFVKRGLTTAQKESVALAIFMEVSMGFETLQGSFPWSWVSSNAKDSSFSEEDLVSNLIGFYMAVRPGIKPLDLCRPVSKTASLEVWDTYGSVGSNKNRTFRPVFHPCDECKGPNRFPPTFEQIQPAPKGVLFREWTVGVVNIFSDPTGTVDEIVVAPAEPRAKF